MTFAGIIFQCNITLSLCAFLTKDQLVMVVFVEGGGVELYVRMFLEGMEAA